MVTWTPTSTFAVPEWREGKGVGKREDTQRNERSDEGCEGVPRITRVGGTGRDPNVKRQRVGVRWKGESN